MNKNSGTLVIFSAPSGCGKDTILKELFKKDNSGKLVLSRSMTTRSPRNQEQDGVDYYFVTRERFEELIGQDKLIEYAEYNGNYYGTPKDPVDEWLSDGKTVILEIEVQGAAKMREKCPQAVGIFILPPSLEELERRLLKRNTDSPEIIAKRVALAPQEIAQSKYFDYCVINDDIGRATDEIFNILINL